MLRLLALALVGTALIFIGTRWLEPAANQIARAFELPRIVQGAVLVAAASSFPELSSVVLAAARHGEFELGVASVIGSAIFNVLVIPGIVVLANRESVSANRDLIYKDVQFYILAVAVTFLTFTLAVVYLPLPGDSTSGSITRGLALIPLGLYGFYLAVQYLDIVEGTTPEPHAGRSAARALPMFLAGIIAILIGVEGLLQASLELGDRFGTPPFLWGLTVVAIGTSLPDLLLSIRAIQADRPIVSLSNVFGSNTFDLLVAIPAGVLVAGSTVVLLDRAVPMFAFLVVATVVVMAAMRSAMSISYREALVMLVLYLVFLLWMILEAVGSIDFIA